jgi:hypothetical protein
LRLLHPRCWPLHHIPSLVVVEHQLSGQVGTLSHASLHQSLVVPADVRMLYPRICWLYVYTCSLSGHWSVALLYSSMSLLLCVVCFASAFHVTSIGFHVSGIFHPRVHHEDQRVHLQSCIMPIDPSRVARYDHATTFVSSSSNVMFARFVFTGPGPASLSQRERC